MPRSGPGPGMGLPRSSAWPVVGSNRPATMLRMVLLPQPEGPRNTAELARAGHVLHDEVDVLDGLEGLAVGQ